MRWVLLSLGFAVVAACSAGSEQTDEDDDGVVITGVGGGATSAATTTSTGAVTSASSVSATSTTSGAGGQGTGGSGGSPPSCPDLGVGEPNESENTAFQLGTGAISDCDGDGSSFGGTISGANDVDWFMYEGDDGPTCVVDPTRSLTQTGSGLRLCKFFECLKGLSNTDVTCPNGTTDVTSGEGRPGCCGSTGFDADLNCTGTIDEHAYVYIRLDQPGATASTCNDYMVDYHY